MELVEETKKLLIETAQDLKAHELRNEVVEELIQTGEAKIAQNWTLDQCERAETAE